MGELTRGLLSWRSRGDAYRSVMCGALLVVFAASALGCSGSQKATLPPEKAKPLKKSDQQKKEEAEAAAQAKADEEIAEPYQGPIRPWAESSYSPRPGSTPDPDLEEFEKVCGAGDVALHEVAQLIAELESEEGEAPSLDVAKFHLRRRGAPYVMPRMWSATMRNVKDEQVAESIKSWATKREPLGVFRCGVGQVEAKDGSRTITALQVDVLAEVQPLPTQVDSGTWVKLKAQLHAPTTEATVLLLPPEGRPRSLRTEIKGRSVSARFSVETEGTWLVQLMASHRGGPRPVAQMYVTADIDPPQGTDTSPVPGEKAYDAALSEEEALLTLLNAAREDQGLPTVKRNRTLDQVARAHSQRMVAQGRISHDTGHGNPAHRVEVAGLSPKATGENVALAGTVVRLHRVLWASPSHRENMLLRRWDEVGISIVKGDDGIMYATQLFADSN